MICDWIRFTKRITCNIKHTLSITHTHTRTHGTTHWPHLLRVPVAMENSLMISAALSVLHTMYTTNKHTHTEYGISRHICGILYIHSTCDKHNAVSRLPTDTHIHALINTPHNTSIYSKRLLPKL